MIRIREVDMKKSTEGLASFVVLYGQVFVEKVAKESVRVAYFGLLFGVGTITI